METDIFLGYGVEVCLSNPDDFLKIKETLQRIGIASHKTKTLYQSCHILHKRGRYAIMHFKEMFLLDGKQSTLDQTDLDRRNTIANLLQQWGLLTIIDEQIEISEHPLTTLKIIKHSEKNEWRLESKYHIGIEKKLYYGNQNDGSNQN